MTILREGICNRLPGQFRKSGYDINQAYRLVACDRIRNRGWPFHKKWDMVPSVPDIPFLSPGTIITLMGIGELIFLRPVATVVAGEDQQCIFFNIQ